MVLHLCFRNLRQAGRSATAAGKQYPGDRIRSRLPAAAGSSAHRDSDTKASFRPRCRKTIFPIEGNVRGGGELLLEAHAA
jgi:hypothetical protein